VCCVSDNVVNLFAVSVMVLNTIYKRTIKLGKRLLAPKIDVGQHAMQLLPPLVLLVMSIQNSHTLSCVSPYGQKDLRIIVTASGCVVELMSVDKRARIENAAYALPKPMDLR
jgi:hypothetical protein